MDSNHYPELPCDQEWWLITGAPKSGKSTLAESFPTPAEVLNWDGAINKYVYTDEERFTKHNITSLEEHNDVVGRFERSEAKTFILDTVDMMVVQISEDICDRMGQPSIGDVPHAAGWERQASRFIKMLERFFVEASSAPNFRAAVVVAHADSEDGMKSLVIRKRLAKYLQGRCVTIGYCYKLREGDEIDFRVDVSGDREVEAGSRNKVIQAAGHIGNNYKDIVRLFSPPKAKVIGALKWLEKNEGVSEHDVRKYLKRKHRHNPIELVAFARRVKKAGPKLRTKILKPIRG